MSGPDPQQNIKVGAPETGPKLLFFSGGTALRGLSRILPQHTLNSVHIVTPFDSGGSSAELRRAFDMPAVGDLRNRLLALADTGNPGKTAVYDLAATRFDRTQTQKQLEKQLDALCAGCDPLDAFIPGAARDLACRGLTAFRQQMPADFDLRGASLGNLIITGFWLENEHDMETAVARFSGLVGARGAVLPVVDKNLHLAAELEDGRLLVGQHRITGKEVDSISSPVQRLWLTGDLCNPAPAKATISPDLAERIAAADLVCFPMGSFYTSIVANLLPRGVGDAVSRARGPRVYVPNLGHDPESLGLDVFASTQRILQTLQRDTGGACESSRFLDYVLVDSAGGACPTPRDREQLERQGIRVVDRRLVSDRSAPLIDENRLLESLVSLI